MHQPAPGGARRIGVVCGSFDRYRDGVSHYVEHLVEHLDGHGVAAEVVAAPRWKPRDVASVAARLHRLRPDVVHVQFAPSAYGYRPAVGVLGALLGRLPLVTTIHEYGTWEWSPRLVPREALRAAERRGLWDREALRLTLDSDAVITSNPNHAVILERRLGRRRGVRVVPIAENVPPVATDRAAARRDVGIGDVPLVVFFGFVHPVKGIPTLLEAVADLAADLPGVRLALVGGFESLALGRAEAAAWRGEVEQRARELEVADAVTTTGWVDDAAASAWLRAADVVALPFNRGATTKSGALLAAAAHGVPIVTTASNPPDPEIVDGEVAAVVPPRDARSLAAALRAVLTRPDLERRLRAGGRALLAGRAWDDIAAAHAEVYDSVAATPVVAPSW